MVLVPALLTASEWLLRALFGGQAAPPDSSHVSTSLFYLLECVCRAICADGADGGDVAAAAARHAVRDESHISASASGSFTQ